MATVVILTGVSGSGKTLIGQSLAQDMGWKFYDADDLHSAENILKMAQGIPLTESDREPWLRALDELITQLMTVDQSAVIACSALRQRYRDRLRNGWSSVYFVFLKGGYDLIHQRLTQRQGHYMKADLLSSQFAALEEPADALVINVAETPDAIVQIIRQQLGLLK